MKSGSIHFVVDSLEEGKRKERKKTLIIVSLLPLLRPPFPPPLAWPSLPMQLRLCGEPRASRRGWAGTGVFGFLLLFLFWSRSRRLRAKKSSRRRRRRRRRSRRFRSNSSISKRLVLFSFSAQLTSSSTSLRTHAAASWGLEIVLEGDRRMELSIELGQGV